MSSDEARSADWADVAAPAIRKRLDRDYGPNGWTIEYRETPRGVVVARLGLYAIDLEEWLYKEAGISETVEGLTIYDAAFLEVAVEIWGVGRGRPATEVGQLPAPPAPAPAEPPPPPTPEPTAPAEPPPPAPPTTPVKPNRQFAPPQFGSRQVWPYFDSLQKHFGVKIWDKIGEHCQAIGVSDKIKDWTEQDYASILGYLFAYFKGLNYYRNEFAGIELATPEPAAATDEAKPELSPEEKAAKKRRGDIKREIIQTVNMTLLALNEKEPAPDEVEKEVKRLSALAHPQAAFIESLRDCTDMGWLERTYVEARKNLTNLQRKQDDPPGGNPESSKIPF